MVVAISGEVVVTDSDDEGKINQDLVDFAFKQSLKLSQPARPLEIFHDLPISKF